MPRTAAWFSDAHSVNFTHAFTANPVCCPARASLLTGRYSHNVREGEWSGGFDCNTRDVTRCGCQRANVAGPAFETAVYANRLRATHRTVYAGKYLNKGYMHDYCQGAGLGSAPPGWDVWHATCRQDFHNMTWLNGTELRDSFGSATYTTAVIGNLSLALLDAHPPGRPLHLVVSFRAPHSPWDPAPWYEHELANTSGRVSRELNPRCRPVDHFAPLEHQLVALHGFERERTSRAYRKRQLTLRSVDEAIDAIMRRLDNNTLVLFTSDHGYHYDMFALGMGKTHPYLADARVPLYARWPAVVSGQRTVTAPVSLVDIAPTILDAAGASTHDTDGRSLLPWLCGVVPAWRRAVLVAHDSLEDAQPWFYFFARMLGSVWNLAYTHVVLRPNDHIDNSYRALYTDNALLYVERTQPRDWHFERIRTRELYNLTADPRQLNNVYASASNTTHTVFAAQMESYWRCRASECP
jgi:N-acetylglucosamine-6-sulfatase